MISKHKFGKVSCLSYVISVGVLHIIGLGLLFLGTNDHSVLLGLGFVAYTLGLRHAFDADHIAAIDNTIRKLLAQEQNPSGVGLFFSLGHSSVVFLMTVFTAVSIQWAEKNMPQLKEIGGLMGTLVSGSFLLFIGLINIMILNDLFKAFLRMRKGLFDEREVEHLLLSRGFIGRFVRPLFKLVNRSWHALPLGFLFGLGFDTASEVALLAIAASALKTSLPIIGILSLPVLFAAGMSLMDTADGIFMMTAYQWAFSTPLRKLYYNLTVTTISVVAAILIGTIELSQVLASQFKWEGIIGSWLQGLDFEWLGYVLVIFFIFSWGVSFGLWKFLHFEDS